MASPAGALRRPPKAPFEVSLALQVAPKTFFFVSLLFVVRCSLSLCSNFAVRSADVVDVVAVAVAVVVIRIRIRIVIHIRIHIRIRFRIRIGIRIRIRIRIRTQMTGRAWCCACTRPAKGVFNGVVRLKWSQ